MSTVKAGRAGASSCVPACERTRAWTRDRDKSCVAIGTPFGMGGGPGRPPRGPPSFPFTPARPGPQPPPARRHARGRQWAFRNEPEAKNVPVKGEAPATPRVRGGLAPSRSVGRVLHLLADLLGLLAGGPGRLLRLVARLVGPVLRLVGGLVDVVLDLVARVSHGLTSSRFRCPRTRNTRGRSKNRAGQAQAR